MAYGPTTRSQPSGLTKPRSLLESATIKYEYYNMTKRENVSTTILLSYQSRKVILHCMHLYTAAIIKVAHYTQHICPTYMVIL